MDQVAKLAACAAMVAMGACSTLGEPAANLLQPGAHYVAMGSSFAAGAGIGPLQPGSPERCGRTTNNYASLLAQEFQLVLSDQGCGGATTAHLLGAWDELPAQLDAVRADTKLVTITVGGNDLNYMGLLFVASCDPANRMIYRGQRIDCPDAAPLPDDDAYAQTKANLVEIARRINASAPDARIVFVQYVSLVPAQLCAATPLSEQSAQDARELARRLAEITAQAAAETGAQVLAVDQFSQDHTACDAYQWSRGMAAGIDPAGGTPWHPTAAGHEAIAAGLADLIDRLD